MKSDQLDQLFTALAKAQGEMTAAAKDCANPFFKSRYADLSSVWNACREPLSKNGLSVLQIVQTTESGDVLHTTLGHSSGQYMTSTMPIRIKTEGKGANELQALGAAITYLRRFALSALVGVAPDDDNDGNGSQYKAQPRQEAPKVAQANFTPYISDEQLATIRKLLASCSHDYMMKVMDWLATKKVDDLPRMPINLYDTVKTRLEAHLAKDGLQESVMEE
jgi:predicted aconitase